MPPLIRPATMNDYEDLCRILAECDALHSARLPGWFNPLADPRLARTREYFAELMQDPNTSVLVAEQDGRIAGAIITLVRDTPPIPILVPRRFGSIDIIVVRQDQRGLGIGRALMAQAEAWAKAMGAQDIQLSVYAFNHSAIRFYESLGYEAISQKMSKDL